MNLRTLAIAVGVLLTLATSVLFIMGIWYNDGRWGGSGGVTFVLAFATFATASFLPAKGVSEAG